MRRNSQPAANLFAPPGRLERPEIAQVLQEAAHSILNEIRDLPNTVSDPHWLDEVAAEEKEGGV